MLATRKNLMFLEFYMTEDMKATRYGIIVTKTVLRDTIAEKTTQLTPMFEFVSFMGRKRDEPNTIEYSKRGIVWEFIIK
jgi:hypothetical protein